MNSFSKPSIIKSTEGHFKYPLSLMMYLVTGFLLGVLGTFAMLGAFLFQQGKRLWGLGLIFTGVVIFSGWAWFLITSRIWMKDITIYHVIFSVLSGLSCYFIQETLVRMLFDLRRVEGFKAAGKLERSNSGSFLNRLTTWNLLFYIMGILFFLYTGMEIFPPGVSKTVFLWLSLEWALIFLIPANIVVLVTGYLGRINILSLVSRVICAFLIGTGIILLISVMETVIGVYFKCWDGLESGDFYPRDPSSFIWVKFLYRDIYSIIMLVGILMYTSLCFLRHTSVWKFLTIRSLVILVVVLVFFINHDIINNEHYYYSLAKTYQYDDDPVNRSKAIWWYRKVISMNPYRQNMEMLYQVSVLEYELGKREKCLKTMDEILDRYSGTLFNRNLVEKVEVIRRTMLSNNRGEKLILDFSVMDREKYTSSNSLLLLTIFSYLHPGIPESELKSSLKLVSREENSIVLPRVNHPVEVRDFCYNLGYETCYGYLTIPEIKDLLKTGGMPLLYINPGFKLVVGYNDDRGVFRVCDYSDLFKPRGKTILDKLKKLTSGETPSFFTERNNQQLKMDLKRKKSRLKRKVLKEIPYSWVLNNLVDEDEKVLTIMVLPSSNNNGKLKMYRQLVEKKYLNDDRVMNAFTLATWKFRMKDFPEALKYFTEASGYDPVRIQSVVYIYFIKLATENRKLALARDSRTIVQGYEENIEGLLREEPCSSLVEEGKTILDRWEREGRMSTWFNSIYVDLYDHHIPGQCTRKCQLLKLLLAQDPGNLDRRDELINLSWKIGDEDTLIEQYEKKLMFNNMDSDTYLALTYLYGRNGNYKKMERSLASIIPVFKPRYDSRFWYGKGELAFWKGKYPRAKKYFLRALELNHFDPVYYAGLVKTFQKLGDMESVRKYQQWSNRIRGDWFISKTQNQTVKEENEYGGK